MSVPGISFVLAVGILSEIGDVYRFPSPGHLASYAGLAPTARNSGGKRRSGRPSKKSNNIFGGTCFWLAWRLLGVKVV